MAALNFHDRLHSMYGVEESAFGKIDSERVDRDTQHKIKVALINSGLIQEGTYGVVTKKTPAVQEYKDYKKKHKKF